MPAIFISYRRADSGGDAARLKDTLDRHFFSEQVFLDINSVLSGAEWRSLILPTLTACDIVLALVGENWLNDENRQRLHEADDLVRQEIGTALKNGIALIPVLIEGADIPPKDLLPDDLRALFDHQATRLSRVHFAHHVTALAKDIQTLLYKSANFEQKARELADAIQNKPYMQWVLAGKLEINWTGYSLFQVFGKALSIETYPALEDKRAIEILEDVGWRWFVVSPGHMLMSRLRGRAAMQREWRIHTENDLLEAAREIVMANFRAYGIHPRELEISLHAL